MFIKLSFLVNFFYVNHIFNNSYCYLFTYWKSSLRKDLRRFDQKSKLWPSKNINRTGISEKICLSHLLKNHFGLCFFLTKLSSWWCICLVWSGSLYQGELSAMHPSTSSRRGSLSSEPAEVAASNVKLVKDNYKFWYKGSRGPTENPRRFLKC